MVALAGLHPEGVGSEALKAFSIKRTHCVLGLPVAGLTADGPEPVRVLRRMVFPIQHVHLQQVRKRLLFIDDQRWHATKRIGGCR